MSIPQVDSLGELFSIAIVAERDAARRYTLLAEMMRTHHEDELAALLERLAVEEQKHANKLKRWTQDMGIRTQAATMPIAWDQPVLRSERYADVPNPYLSTPYTVLAWAVVNEDRAFRFYTYLAAVSRDRSVREHAEALAKEELDHAALLRANRRRAYHARRPRGVYQRFLKPTAVQSLPCFLSAAWTIEKRIAQRLANLDKQGADLSEVMVITHRIAGECEKVLKELIAWDPVGLEALQTSESVAVDNRDAMGPMEQLDAEAERAFEFYDRVETEATKEATMYKAQQLSAMALQRLSYIKQRLAQAAT